VEPARLAPPVGPRLAETGRDRHGRPADVAGNDLELVPLAHRGLVDVAGEDQLRSRLDERGQHVVPPRDGLLPRPPGRADQLVVEDHDPQRSGWGLGELGRRAVELVLAQPARLVTPRADGVEADDQQPFRAVDRLGRLPEPLELRERPREPGGEGVRDVVVPRDREQGQAEAAEEARRPLVLVAAPAVGQVAARHDQLGARPLDQARERALDLRILACAGVQVGQVEDPRRHRVSRLLDYTGCMADETAEIFDDLYLGMRAGGALRKQRRGEPLTMEEQEALGRWQRLSTWRKIIAVGAFGLGTFGLGFTLGGLVFGRWRRAKA
jgi:hypothetical protein